MPFTQTGRRGGLKCMCDEGGGLLSGEIHSRASE